MTGSTSRPPRPCGAARRTKKAKTLRGRTVLDGPFAETKEQLLGFYVADFPSEDVAVEAIGHLQRANPTAVYEIRPIKLYIPGAPFPETAAET